VGVLCACTGLERRSGAPGRAQADTLPPTPLFSGRRRRRPARRHGRCGRPVQGGGRRGSNGGRDSGAGAGREARRRGAAKVRAPAPLLFPQDLKTALQATLADNTRLRRDLDAARSEAAAATAAARAARERRDAATALAARWRAASEKVAREAAAAAAVADQRAAAAASARRAERGARALPEPRSAVDRVLASLERELAALEARVAAAVDHTRKGGGGC